MLKKKEIHCCTECGRDTTRSCKVCIKCMPNTNGSFFNSHEEEIGRNARPFNSLFGENESDENTRPLKHSLL